MNNANTDGLALKPPRFFDGFDVWSSEDGTATIASYHASPNAAIVSADQDFGGCRELLKTNSVETLRWAGETPFLPGCYLRIRARMKAVSGNLPSVRVAAWVGDAANAHVSGLIEAGPSVGLTAYGDIVEIAAIAGIGQRTGVDMTWGGGAVYAHVGPGLTGATGGVVRNDDIASAFYRAMMDWDDVRDFGAVGDGTTDDHPAFEAADLAAAGRDVLVPAGVYALGANQTFENCVRFGARSRRRRRIA